MPYMQKLSGLHCRFEPIKRAEFTKKRIERLGLHFSSSNAYDPLSGCIVQEMECLRCNYSFKANLNKVGASYNVSCPYCYREDQLRITKGCLP